MQKAVLDELTIGEIKRFRKKVSVISWILISLAVFVGVILFVVLLYYLDPLISLMIELRGF